MQALKGRGSTSRIAKNTLAVKDEDGDQDLGKQGVQASTANMANPQQTTEYLLSREGLAGEGRTCLGQAWNSHS